MIGFVNIYKPSGESSSRTVQFVKHVLINKLGANKKIKVGHFGTLDPNACGVLPIAIGTACRLFDYTLDKIKVYEATVIFGKNTDTLDDCGEVFEEIDCDVSEESLKAVIQNFPTSYAQIPPKVSAKSVGGVRAYKLARSGVDFALEAREVKIFNLELLKKIEKNKYSILVECSAGTYIRSLCRDLGEMLGVPAIMGDLLRRKSGEFDLSTAVDKSEFENNPTKYILPVDIVLKDKEKAIFDGLLLEKLKNGVRVPVDKEYADAVVVDNCEIIYGIGRTFNGEFGFTTRLR